MAGAAPARYDAFISYSHGDDSHVSRVLQPAIERLGSPWFRARSLRLFRDETNLAAHPQLWPQIETALAASSWLILMASPRAAASPWVGKELQWWLAHRSAERILIAVTGGTVRWDAQRADFDWSVTDALPRMLAGAFAHEPKWVDLSELRSAGQISASDPRVTAYAADFAATVRGMPKDELIGLHVTRRRRTRLLVATVVTVLLALVAATAVAATVAVRQRDAAQRQTDVATARALSAAALSNIAGDLTRAHLLAVAAYRMNPDDPQARAALLRTAVASPHLVRTWHVPAPVTTLATGSDGALLVAGGADGRAYVNDLNGNAAAPAVEELGDGPVGQLSLSRDGRVVAALVGTTVAVLRRGEATAPVRPAPPAARLEASAVGVTPAGRGLVVAWRAPPGGPADEVKDVLAVYDLPSGQLVEQATVDPVFGLALPDEDTVIVSSLSDQHTRRLPGLRPFGRAGRHPVAAAGVGAYSDNGRYFMTIGPIETYVAAADADATVQRTLVPSGVSEPEAAAVSPDGRRVAIAAAGTITAWGAIDASPRWPVRVDLTGNSSVDHITFLGGPNRLASATGSQIHLWDLRQVSRIATPADAAAGDYYRLPVPPALLVSEDGRRVVLGDEAGAEVTVVDLDSGRRVAHLGPEPAAGEPLWISPDGTEILLAGVEHVHRWRLSGRPDPLAWPVEASHRPVAVAADANRFVAAYEDGSLRAHDRSDGRQIAVLRPPSASPFGLGPCEAALRADARAAILVMDGRARLVDTDRRTERDLGGAGVSCARYVGAVAALEHEDGRLEILGEDGGAGTTASDGGGFYPGRYALNGDRSLLARLRTDGLLVLTDVGSSTALGSIDMPRPEDGVGLGESPWGSTALAFRPGGAGLITATSGGRLMVWTLDPERQVAIACALAARDLTAVEWTRATGVPPPASLRCGAVN